MFQQELENVSGYAALSNEFTWGPGDGTFPQTVNDHFNEVNLPEPGHGVYIVRARNEARPVLYVGSNGKVGQNGTWTGGQNLPQRLCAGRGANARVTADEWAGGLADGGSLVIQYAILCVPTVLAPATAESRLLQAYLAQYAQLPAGNGRF